MLGFFRTLSLLGNRGTLFLLAVNRDKEEMRKRLALSLHYVLYNEFFAAEGGGQSKRDHVISLSGKARRTVHCTYPVLLSRQY